jgi:hypothetical protein
MILFSQTTSQHESTLTGDGLQSLPYCTEQLPSARAVLGGSLLADRERLLRDRLLSRAADAAALRVLEVMIRSRRRRSVPCTSEMRLHIRSAGDMYTL